jgi:hypothetical protein
LHSTTRLVAGIGLLLLIGFPAVAKDTSGPMRCTDAASAWRSRDIARIGAAIDEIERVMDRMGAAFVARQAPSVLQPLTREGRNAVTAVAVRYCQEDERLTVGRAARDAYLGLRDFQRTLGNIP